MECQKYALATNAHNDNRMDRHNKRGKEDNVNQHRHHGIAVGLATRHRVAIATAPGKRHEY